MSVGTDLKRTLQGMDDYDFEHFVADLWGRMGWETEVSNQSSDKGIDVVATRRSPYEEKALIQAKRYGPNTTVGSPAIQQYASLKHQRHGVDKVLVVTTNGFSGQAEELAHQLNVKLVDGDDLVGLVEELDAMDLVERYVPAREPESEPAFETPASVDGPRGVEPPTEPSNAGGNRSQGNDGRVAKRLPDERWKWVAGATGAWVLGIALAGADAGVIVLLAWAALPYAILKDGTWTRWRRWYAAAALVPVFAILVGGWYLLMRWRAVGFESADGVGENGDSTVEEGRPSPASSGAAVGSVDVTDDYSDAYDHYTEAVEDVKRLKREGRRDEAESLLRWCIESAERQAREQGYDTVPPWYYEHLSIVYREDGRYDDEVTVLERYVENGGRKDELLDRLDRAYELAA